MKLLIPLLLLVMHPAFGQITNPEKASQDLCDIEWQISDKAASTEDDTSKIVKNAMQDFKAMGYSFSDFGIDENDYEKVSVEGAQGFRKMVGKMTTPYAEARSFFRERMMPLCIKNVLEGLNKTP